MTPERYLHVCQICYDAFELEASQRAAFLDRACADDESLRREVEAMLANEGRLERFLEAPALEVAAEHMAEFLVGEKTTLPFNDRQSNDTNSSPPETRVEPFAPGEMLGGRYLVEGKLEEGGVGLVFLARDQKLHRTPVVIKVLREDLRHKAWFEKKFKQEIAALAQIDHPGVVRALDVGELSDGRPYLVMQYVSGVSLRSVIPPLGMELERVASLMRQMGQALAAAHDQGVIHRDLKPENIMLQTVGGEEYVKLIDFGIATVRETAEGEGRTTAVIGTRDYVAPEQLRGKPVPASDIYALGVIAYEMVTGRRPFNADSLAELIDLQRDGVVVKPCDLRPGLPAAAQEPILKALSFTFPLDGCSIHGR
jgi:eukaryotic-like serine/threonine-protein kinase